MIEIRYNEHESKLIDADEIEKSEGYIYLKKGSKIVSIIDEFCMEEVSVIDVPIIDYSKFINPIDKKEWLKERNKF